MCTSGVFAGERTREGMREGVSERASEREGEREREVEREGEREGGVRVRAWCTEEDCNYYRYLSRTQN